MERLQDLDKLKEFYDPKKEKTKGSSNKLKDMFIQQVKKEVDNEMNLSYDEKLMAKFQRMYKKAFSN